MRTRSLTSLSPFCWLLANAPPMVKGQDQPPSLPGQGEEELRVDWRKAEKGILPKS